MKKWILSFIVNILPLVANADAVEINGIYYNLSTSSSNTAEVTSKYGYKYSGDIVIPASVTYENIEYSVTTIRANAFEWCSSMTSITIPSSLKSIGSQAFNYCSGLTAVYITDLESWCNITFDNYGSNPLYYAHHIYLNGLEIRDLVIPDGIVNVKDNVFYGGSGLTSITIPTSVKYIGTYAFSDCTGLSSVTIPNSVTSTGIGVFRGCTALTSVNIPNSITTIEGTVFAECSSLISVTIPSSVTSIDNRAFWKCSNIKKVYCLKENVPSTGSDIFQLSNINNATLYVPVSSIENYQSVEPWNNFNEIKAINYDEVSISAGNIRTYSSTYDLDFSDVIGLTAYIINEFNSKEGTLTLSPVTFVKAGEGLLLKGEAGEYVVPHTTTDATYTNYLVGVQTTTSVSPTNGDYTNFILADGEHGVKFYALSQESNIVSGDAYLSIPTADLPSNVLASGISIIFGDEKQDKKCATPIISVNGGLVNLSCETEGVTFKTNVTYNSSNENLVGNELILSGNITCNLSVYATKEGYEDSDVATKEIVLRVGAAGDANSDGVVDIADAVKIVNFIVGKINTLSRPREKNTLDPQ